MAPGEKKWEKEDKYYFFLRCKRNFWCQQLNRSPDKRHAMLESWVFQLTAQRIKLNLKLNQLSLCDIILAVYTDKPVHLDVKNNIFITLYLKSGLVVGVLDS